MRVARRQRNGVMTCAENNLVALNPADRIQLGKPSLVVLEAFNLVKFHKRATRSNAPSSATGPATTPERKEDTR